MEEVHLWESGNWVVLEPSPLEDGDIETVNAAGYNMLINLGDLSDGIGITVYQHNSGSKWLVSLVLAGEDNYLLLESREQLFKCLEVYTPIAEASWRRGKPKLPEVIDGGGF